MVSMKSLKGRKKKHLRSNFELCTFVGPPPLPLLGLDLFLLPPEACMIVAVVMRQLNWEK
jgi:hypothetical protein